MSKRDIAKNHLSGGHFQKKESPLRFSASPPDLAMVERGDVAL
jgi:hypothetical protein